MSDPSIEFAVNLLGNVLGELVAQTLEEIGRRTGRRRRTRRELGADYSAELIRGLTLELGALDRPGGPPELTVGAAAYPSPANWQAAAEEVLACLARAAPLDADLALDSDLRPDTLEGRILSRGGPVAPLPEGVGLAFDLLLTAACRQLIQALMALPEFAEEVPAVTIQQVIQTRDAVEQLGRRDEIVRRESARTFEQRYLDHVAQSLGQFELFGVIRGRDPRRQSFKDSYVNLAVARTGGFDQTRDSDDELTGAGIDVVNAFADNRRLFLRGNAGAGKTTVLQWLAAGAAADRRDGRPGPLGQCVPFLVHLRDYADRGLPLVEELPAGAARVIEGERPAGWATAMFHDGTALLLVDGVDEVAAEHRPQMRRWLEDLTLAYPAARYVVTARPFAVPEGWLGAGGFEPFDLLPLSAQGIRDFLACWHAAVRREHGQDAEKNQWLDKSESGLAELMSTRPELRRLAASPLLCGLLCALYQDRNLVLPRDRKSLFDAALDLLLVGWDEQRSIKIEDGTALSKEEQLVVLQRLAYSLVKNQDLVVSTDQAVSRIEHAMRGLRPHHSDPRTVLQHTLERTGLLQEPRADQIQFVHRTFRDYLAAKEVVDSGDLNFLVEQAHLDQWHDVVIMSAAHARPREREQLLHALLRGNNEVRRDPAAGARLHLLAAACLEQAHVIGSGEVRRMVQQAAARLIPPATLDDADFLARAGSFVLGLLPGPENLTDYQSACVVRTIARIGGEASREHIRRFAAVNQSMVIDELLRAWRDSDDPEDYARTVLGGIEFGDREVQVRGWHRVRYLPALTRLRNLVSPGDLTPLDPIAAMPSLRRLALIQNSVLRDLSPLATAPALERLDLTWCTSLRDVGPLSGNRTLRSLHLAGCTLLRDLAPLADSSIDELNLHLMSCDLESLDGAPITSLTIRDRRLAAGLHVLPGSLRLRRLTLDNLPDERNVRGVDRWPDLEELACAGIPGSEEITELARLPRLRTITLSQILQPGARDEMRALRERLPNVEIVAPEERDGRSVAV
ncbi:MAG TPA: NACHT domain-containing protein [Actinocrinis sp.]|nr:NACHT domain-containing protein [Actinocrinis sp.]